MEINRLGRETGRYVLDGVMSVVDVENWKGYEDTSYTAKMQARYTDLIVLNKWELVSERRLEDVEDAILALELDVQCPRLKSQKGWVDKNVIFGLDARLASSSSAGTATEETKEHGQHSHEHNHEHSSEVEVLSVSLRSKNSTGGIVDTEKLVQFLHEPTKDEVYRIKGILYASTPPKSSDSSTSTMTPTPTPPASIGSQRQRHILNYAFGRWTFTHVPLLNPVTEEEPELRLTVITARYESNKWKKQIESSGLITLANSTEGTLLVEKVA